MHALSSTDLDVCGHTSPCLNSGTCVNNGPDNFTCSNCADGFEGRTCDMETDECVANLCLNGALCKVGVANMCMHGALCKVGRICCDLH